jgi:hypothetical protein
MAHVPVLPLHRSSSTHARLGANGSGGGTTARLSGGAAAAAAAAAVGYEFSLTGLMPSDGGSRMVQQVWRVPVLYPRAPLAMKPAARDLAGGLSVYRNHILICGINERIGLLLRALTSVVPLPPQAYVPGMPEQLSRQAATFAADSLAVPAKRAGGGSTSASSRHLPIVILCLMEDRPTEKSMNGMLARSANILSEGGATMCHGSPSDMNDLLKAGVLEARAAIVLSTRRTATDSNDNLSDDVDALVIASAIYKLNPSLHIMTEARQRGGGGGGALVGWRGGVRSPHPAAQGCRWCTALTRLTCALWAPTWVTWRRAPAPSWRP